MSGRIIGLVAGAVFRESVRDRVLYNLVAFALLLIGASLLLAQLTAGQDVKIVKDLGLSAMSAFGLFIALFIGIGLVSKEVERRTIYSLLAKPVRRSELVAGKYAGLALFFSAFASPLLAAAFTAALFIAGHFTADLQHLESVVRSPAVALMLNGLYHVLPDFALFDVNAAVVHGQPIAPNRVALAVGYAVLYSGGLLALAVLIFSRRDFK
jgi:Cu-processing system permease protein